MRILLITLNFAPEPTGIGKYSGELAEALAEAGHEVRVICAPPYYPHWRVPDEHQGWGWRSSHPRPGLTVVRCPTWVPARPGGLARLVHLASFALGALPVTLAAAAWRPGLVFAVAPALSAAPGAWLAARLCGARAQLHVQDFELDAAFALGLLRGSLLRRAVVAVERVLLRRFDRVSTISGRMADRLVDKGVPRPRVELLPNWVDVQRLAAHPEGPCMRRELAIGADARVCLFSGTVNRKQGLETVVAAARLLLPRTEIVFVICGDGDWLPHLREQAQGLTNLRFLPLQPADRVGALLSMADVQLLPQTPGAADLVMPSKLGGMLASGRPVVAAAAPGTEVARVVAGCGVVVPPEDPGALAAAVATLCADPQLCGQLGAAGRARALQTLDRAAVLGPWLANLAADGMNAR